MAWATGGQASRFLSTAIEQQKASAAQTAAEAREAAAKKTPSKGLMSALQTATALANVGKAGTQMYQDLYQKPYWEAQAENTRVRTARERVGSYFDELNEFTRGMKNVREVMGPTASKEDLAIFMQTYGQSYLGRINKFLDDPNLADHERERYEDLRDGFTTVLGLMNDPKAVQTMQLLHGQTKNTDVSALWDGTQFGAGLFGPETQGEEAMRQATSLHNARVALTEELLHDAEKFKLGHRDVNAIEAMVKSTKEMRTVMGPQQFKHWLSLMMNTLNRAQQAAARQGIERSPNIPWRPLDDATRQGTLGQKYLDLLKKESVSSAIKQVDPGNVRAVDVKRWQQIHGAVARAGHLGKNTAGEGESIIRGLEGTDEDYNELTHLAYRTMQMGAWNDNDLKVIRQIRGGLSQAEIDAKVQPDINSVSVAIQNSGGEEGARLLSPQYNKDALWSAQSLTNQLMHGTEAQAVRGAHASFGKEFGGLAPARDILQQASTGTLREGTVVGQPQGGIRMGFLPTEIKAVEDWLGWQAKIMHNGIGGERDQILDLLMANAGPDADPQELLHIVRLGKEMAAQGLLFQGDSRQLREAGWKILDGVERSVRSPGNQRMGVNVDEGSLILVANDLMARTGVVYEDKYSEENPLGRDWGIFDIYQASVADTGMVGDPDQRMTRPKSIVDVPSRGAPTEPGRAAANQNFNTETGRYHDDQQYAHNFIDQYRGGPKGIAQAMVASVTDGAMWANSDYGYKTLNIRMPSEEEMKIWAAANPDYPGGYAAFRDTITHPSRISVGGLIEGAGVKEGEVKGITREEVGFAPRQPSRKPATGEAGTQVMGRDPEALAPGGMPSKMPRSGQLNLEMKKEKESLSKLADDPINYPWEYIQKHAGPGETSIKLVPGMEGYDEWRDRWEKKEAAYRAKHYWLGDTQLWGGETGSGTKGRSATSGPTPGELPAWIIDHTFGYPAAWLAQVMGGGLGLEGDRYTNLLPRTDSELGFWVRAKDPYKQTTSDIGMDELTVAAGGLHPEATVEEVMDAAWTNRADKKEREEQEDTKGLMPAAEYLRRSVGADEDQPAGEVMEREPSVIDEYDAEQKRLEMEQEFPPVGEEPATPAPEVIEPAVKPQAGDTVGAFVDALATGEVEGEDIQTNWDRGEEKLGLSDNEKNAVIDKAYQLWLELYQGGIQSTEGGRTQGMWQRDAITRMERLALFLNMVRGDLAKGNPGAMDQIIEITKELVKQRDG